jgi:hypothetical protein
MPTREQLRREYDAAIWDLQKLGPRQNLTTGFVATIGDSLFDGSAALSWTEGSAVTAQRFPALADLIGGKVQVYFATLLSSIEMPKQPRYARWR